MEVCTTIQHTSFRIDRLNQNAGQKLSVHIFWGVNITWIAFIVLPPVFFLKWAMQVPLKGSLIIKRIYGYYFAYIGYFVGRKSLPDICLQRYIIKPYLLKRKRQKSLEISEKTLTQVLPTLVNSVLFKSFIPHLNVSYS